MILGDVDDKLIHVLGAIQQKGGALNCHVVCTTYSQSSPEGQSSSGHASVHFRHASQLGGIDVLVDEICAQGRHDITASCANGCVSRKSL